jgi:SAM-dependent methyltransferase
MSDPYPDFVARFYDAVYARVRDGVDNEYYLTRMTAAGGPVLEVGVGTGRLLCEARRRGADVWGIDVSSAMIERLRSKLPPEDRARAWVDDAVTMRSDRRFALAVAPFRVLSHVPAVEEQIRFLDNLHDHLLPGGTLIFDLYVPSLRLLLDGLDEHLDFDGEHAPGQRLRRYLTARSDLVRQMTRARMTFVWDEGNEERRADWDFEMRFFFRYEIEHLVARSKLCLVAMHGDFEEGPLDEGSREFVVVCRRDR